MSELARPLFGVIPLARAMTISAALAAMSGDAVAQSFFSTLATDPTVGADRGAASQIRKLEEPTAFLTFSNTGSDPAGRLVLGFGLALPDLAVRGDQLDLTGIWAGPSEEGWRELLAGGLSYRIPVGRPDLVAFFDVSYGDVELGTSETLTLGVRGDRLQVAAGLRRQASLGGTARLTLGAEVIARSVQSEALGFPVIDEELRLVRGSVLYANGVPNIAQQRLAFSVSHGLDGFGSSAPGNPLGSTPGAETSFWRASFAAEASIPLGPNWVVNGGIIGQWSDDSLPASQRCGFGTNAYARGFDYGLVLGDQCLGTRVELAYNLVRPDLQNLNFDATQLFGGIDAGTIANAANAFLPEEHDSWSSLSIGVRTLRGGFLGEVAATRILDRPDVAVDQDQSRLWLRMAYQF